MTNAVPYPQRRRTGATRVARELALAATARLPLGGLVAALVAARLAASGTRAQGAALALITYVGSAQGLRSSRPRASHLPVLRVAFPALVAAVAALAGYVAGLAFDVGHLKPGDWVLVAVAATAVVALSEGARAQTVAPRPTRIAFVGGAEAARRLREDLARTGVGTYVVAGRIGARGDDGAVPVIGALGSLRATVVRERIDLVVLGGTVARLVVFDELAATCLDLPLRMTELPDFYEDVFGHVPTAEINAAWFAHLAYAHARHPSPLAKRALDVALALVFGVATLPLLGLLALLVRLDGGPALFAQTRIGEGGRPFRLFKLRTMRPGSGDETVWAQENDPRATPIGRVLRRTHCDELPQLWNVLRGEMSFVGPRPEQLAFVERLEAALPFYQRRHLIRPGLTGWAQVRCGYAGTDVGAAWKLCNDLYYVKHRSLALDLLLLIETAGLLTVGPAIGGSPPLAVVEWSPALPIVVPAADDVAVVAMAPAAGEEATG